MRDMQKMLQVLALVLVVASLSPSSTTATEPQRSETPLAHLNVGPVSIDWLPTIESERVVLVVAGPQGAIIRREFEAGQTPSLSLFDRNGDRLPDGTYTFELRFMPRLNQEVREQLLKGRENGDDSVVEELRKAGKLPERPLVHWGSFSLRNGSPMTVDQSLRGGTAKFQSTTAKQTISEDLVVQGNACIGDACTATDPIQVLKLKSDLVRIFFEDTDARDWALQANDATSEHFFLQDVGALTIPFSVQGGAPDNSLVVGSSGDLGVGTSTPTQDVHIVSGVTPNLRFEQDGSAGLTPHIWDIGGNETHFFVREVATGATMPLRIRAGAPSNSIFVSPTGNVGIATTFPAVRLDVKANGASQTVARLQNSNAAGFSGIEYLDEIGDPSLFFGIDNANSRTRLNSFKDHPIAILTNHEERIRVTSAGHVGIGTSVPSRRLEVSVNHPGEGVMKVHNSSGTGYSGIEYTDIAGDTVLFFGIDNVNLRTRLNSIANYPISILTNSQERIRVTSAGDVGIGTSTPASKLHVSGGDIRVSGGSFIDDGTTLNVPDYVFDPRYKLMPLHELAAFVAEKRHLPNVPSAADVQREGLNLSAFPIRLLEKVEELALYTINQQKQIDGLIAENAELKVRLITLEQERGKNQ